jgi:phosphohistidine phosphatase
MNLYILRHGIAVEPGTAGFAKDSERSLTPKGKRKLRQIAKALKEMDLCFDLIVSSPYVRARQTAQIIGAGFKNRQRLELSDTLTPSGSTRKLIELLNGLAHGADDVLLVGHEPYLSELISLLISGDTRAGVVMKKGGLCKLAVNSLHHGRCAMLEWLLTPKQMQQLG